jgi:hopanoid biosynthesis associated RND transporter like protein HpnN
MGTARNDWTARMLGIWVSGVLRHRRLTIAGFLIVAGLGLGYARSHLGIDTDTSGMISPELPWRQNYLEYRHNFPARDRNLIVVVDSPVAEAATAFATALAERLAARPDLYRSVFLPAHDPFFERNGLLYLDVAALESLSARLAAVQPLLGRLQQGLAGTTLVELLTEILAREPSRAGELEPLLVGLTAALDAVAAGRREALSWQALLNPEQLGTTPELVLIEPVPDLARALPAAAAIEQLRDEIAALARADSPALVRARVTGVVAMEHEELVSVSRGAGWAGIAALVMVAAVLFTALRSLKLLILSLMTLLVGLSWTVAFAAWSVGHLNLLSVAFAVLYVGLGVDFLLHIALRLRELASEQRPPDLVEGVRSVGPSLVICALTTAVGFYAFIPTPFQGVSELGLISGTGMLISLFTSVTLYPALLGEFCSAGDLRPLASGRSRSLGAVLLRWPRGVLVGTLLVALAAVLALPQVRFDNNPIHLRDPNSESVAAVRELAAAGSAPPLSLVAVAPNRTVAGQWVEQLRALPLVRDARTLDSWVPADQSDKLALLEDLALLLGPGFAEVEPLAPDPARLTTALRTLALTLREVPGPSAAQRAAAARIAAVLAELEAAGPAGTERLAALEQDLVAYLPMQLARLERALEAHAFTRAELPPGLVARWVGPQGQELIEISPAENTYDNAAARRFVAAARAAVGTVTGLPVVHEEASATVIQAFRLAFAYALIMVLVVLWFFELRFMEAALIIGPVLLASVVTAGATVALGVDFNFANIIALPLLLGVGVDNGIHVVHRARHGAAFDARRLRDSTSRAVFASGLTTIASFGNLAFSSHLGMASMGRLLTLGMIAALVASLLVLPALLLVLRRA